MEYISDINDTYDIKLEAASMKQKRKEKKEVILYYNSLSLTQAKIDKIMEIMNRKLKEASAQIKTKAQGKRFIKLLIKVSAYEGLITGAKAKARKDEEEF